LVVGDQAGEPLGRLALGALYSQRLPSAGGGGAQKISIRKPSGSKTKNA
jgi:hypothetical protein